MLSVIRRIPAGRVIAYGAVAALAGKPRAARAVGNIMRDAREPGLPYHRVIAAGGRLGGYSSLALKRQLLTAEGLTVTATRVKQFGQVSWPDASGAASHEATKNTKTLATKPRRTQTITS